MQTYPNQQSSFTRCLSPVLAKIPRRRRLIRLHKDLTRRSVLSTLVMPAVWLIALGTLGVSARAQMVDNTQAINPINAGINKSLTQEIGTGRGNVNIPDSSLFIINRDAFRAVRRGRQLFQRKFTRVQRQGPGVDDS